MSAKNLQTAKTLRNGKPSTKIFSAEWHIPEKKEKPLCKVLKNSILSGSYLEKVMNCVKKANFFCRVPSNHTVTNTSHNKKEKQMMNKKIVISCALALTLGLTACGGSKDVAASAPADSVVSTVIDEEIMNKPAEPVEGPAEGVVDDMPAVMPEMPTVDAETGEQTNKPAKPEVQPEVKPEVKPESTPEVKPEASAPSANVPIADVAAKVEGAMGELPSMMDLDAETVSFLYGIDANLLDGFVAKLPMMNVHATEFFVAQVKDGNMDAVKAGIANRLVTLEQQWEHYLADQYELVKNAKVVTSGNYILLCIGHEAEAAANAFTGALA